MHHGVETHEELVNPLKNWIQNPGGIKQLAKSYDRFVALNWVISSLTHPLFVEKW